MLLGLIIVAGVVLVGCVWHRLSTEDTLRQNGYDLAVFGGQAVVFRNRAHPVWNASKPAKPAVRKCYWTGYSNKKRGLKTGQYIGTLVSITDDAVYTSTGRFEKNGNIEVIG